MTTWPILIGVLSALLLAGCASRTAATAGDQGDNPPRLTARVYDSGFELSHDTYNGMGVGTDGKIYYVLCSESIDVGGKMYAYDSQAGKVRYIGDLTEASGEKDLKAIPQGKSHVAFYEDKGKLYFATHVGYYSLVDGMEKMGIPPAGYKPYPGGHFLSYDMRTGGFEKLATAPGGEGILSMTMDKARGVLYGLTWPSGNFIRCDLAARSLKNFGSVSAQGENGRGATYRTLCRSLALDPRDGTVYFTTSDGWIYRYRNNAAAIEKVEGEDLKKDYFGLYDPTSPGHMGYNWRQTFWYSKQNVIYGVHGNSGYLFRIDPSVPRIEVLDRITSMPSKRAGMFDQFSYGYLGFALGPDDTIYYLTGGPIYVQGRRVAGKTSTAMGEAKGQEDLHLITYHIPSGRYRDHGAIFFEDGSRPAYVNSIAVAQDGTVYTLSRVRRNGKVLTDLISVRIADR